LAQFPQKNRASSPPRRTFMPFALVMDGYVDEPACFGVPPYISPYVRYAFGALSLAGMEVAYLTCDAWRRTPREDLWRRADLLVVISGLTVPGRYRGGSPLTLRELEALAALPRSGPLVLGGTHSSRLRPAGRRSGPRAGAARSGLPLHRRSRSSASPLVPLGPVRTRTHPHLR